MRAAPRYLLLALAVAGCTGQVGVNGEGASGTGAGTGTGSAGSSGSAGAGNSPGPGLGGSGNIGGPGTGGASVVPPDLTFACDATAKAPVAALRRLTMAQYRNTIADLAAWAVGGASAGQTVMTEIAAPIDALPEDRREAVPQDLHGSYRRLDQSLQQIHVEATYDVAVALGAALTTTARLGTVVGACATDTSTTNDATCLDAFIKKFGARALRRPLATDEVDFYKTAYGTSTTPSAAAYADLIGLFVTAPEFMYFVEHGAAAVSGQTGVYDLSPHELASRLSYQLWQTAPDDALLAAAADGTLLDRGGLRRAGDAPAGRRPRPSGPGRVLRRLDEGRGSARDGREERRRRVQGVRGHRSAGREAAPGDDRRRGRDARLLHLDGAVGDRVAVHQRSLVRPRHAPGEALRRPRLERQRRRRRRCRPGSAPAC